MTTDVKVMLDERETRYGVFTGQAKISQELKLRMHCAPKWGTLSYDQREALDMVVHKIARLLNGDPDYADNWIDIAGYATLVASRLEKAA